MEKLKERHIKLITLFLFIAIIYKLYRYIYRIYFFSDILKRPLIPKYMVNYAQFPYYIFIGITILVFFLLLFFYFFKNIKYRKNWIIIILIYVISQFLFDAYLIQFYLKIIPVDFFA